MFVPNVAVATRDLADELNKPRDHNEPSPAWVRHPEDFEMWMLGQWDAESGRFDTAHDGGKTEPIQLCVLSTLVTTKN